MNIADGKRVRIRIIDCHPHRPDISTVLERDWTSSDLITSCHHGGSKRRCGRWCLGRCCCRCLAGSRCYSINRSYRGPRTVICCCRCQGNRRCGRICWGGCRGSWGARCSTSTTPSTSAAPPPSYRRECNISKESSRAFRNERSRTPWNQPGEGAILSGNPNVYAITRRDEVSRIYFTLTSMECSCPWAMIIGNRDIGILQI